MGLLFGLLLIGGLVFLMTRVGGGHGGGMGCCGGHGAHGAGEDHRNHQEDMGPRAVNAVRDPVCGMAIDRDEAGARIVHRGRFLYFCSISCKDQFEKEPSRYIEDAEVIEVPNKLNG